MRFHDRRPGLGRLLAGVGAATFVVTALSTSGASAVGVPLVISNPHATPGPGFAATGVHTDACDKTTAPGWIGAASATVGATVAGAAKAHFGVRDTTVKPAVELFKGETPVAADGTAQVQLSGLKDGHTYTWHARATAEGESARTEACHFRVDLTPPSLSVNSTDFPASGSGVTPPKFAGQSGMFTIKGADVAPVGGAASGVACYQYALAPVSLSIFTSCAGPNTIAAAADGSASLQLKPTDWGTNNLVVQAMDNAGNVSQPFSYNFYAPWNPNPPQALGDVDNDGVPDIVLPDAAGNLQVISTDSGNTVPSETVPAAAAPSGGSWTSFEVVHRGWDNTAPADSVFARNLSSPQTKANVYEYRNQGTFNLQPSNATLIPRPSTCADTAANPVTCPADYANDWAAADQIVAFGPMSPLGPTPSLLTLENGNLWLFGDGNLQFGSEDAQKLTTTGNWTGRDLIAPGPDAKGNQALWARDRATGQLHVYPLPLKADGNLDFSALADPTSGVVAGGFTTAVYPTLGSSGDINGDGVADLWAVTADRHLVTFNGYTAPKDLGALK